MYEPIINLIAGEMAYELEGEIYRAIQKYAVDVNKEELLKALQYDRDQYDKGYQDGLNADKWIPCSERLPIIEDEPSDYAEDVGRRFLITDSDGYVYESTFWKYANVFNDNAIAWQTLPEPYKGERE